MKFIIGSCVLLLLLSSCGDDEKKTETAGTGETVAEETGFDSKKLEECLEEVESDKKDDTKIEKKDIDSCETLKQEFFVETTELEDFPSNYNIKKIGKLSSTQSVKLSSNASGRVSNIYVKEGQKVKSGQLLASLADNIGSYNINVDKASNAISRAKINYDSQKIALNKQIADLELSLTRLGQNLVNLEKTNSQNIARTQNDIENINAEASLQKTDLNIEKLNQNIAKLELDAENQVISNIETINGFKSRIVIEQSSLRLSLDDVIEFADEILGITPENEDENEDFDTYLGAKDKIQRNESEQALRTLISFRKGEFETFVPNDLEAMSDEQILTATLTGETGYALVKDVLAKLELTFQNSIISVGRLSETDIDGYIAQINGYQSSTQLSYSGFITLKSQIESFMRTYENTENSTQKQIELLKKDRDILLNDREIQAKNLDTTTQNSEIGLESTKTQGEDAIINLKNQIASTELAFSNAKQNKTITLRSLDNQIREANLNYSQAVKERAKLSIYSPISGSVSSVEIDLGQEVNNGGILFNIENTSKSEIVIGLTNEELEIIKTGKKVTLTYGDTNIKGKIFSISDVADQNLNFKTTVQLDSPLDKLGEIIEVSIPISSKNVLVPLNIIDVDSSGETGILAVWNEERNDFSKLGVELGSTYDADIEVVACENPDFGIEDENQDQFIACEFFERTEIVTSNLNNFDENKFKIVRKK